MDHSYVPEFIPGYRARTLVLVGIADYKKHFLFFFKDLKVLVPDQALQRNNIHTLANHE